MQNLPGTNLNFAPSQTKKAQPANMKELLCNQIKTTKGNALQIDDLPYIDNGTFLFSTLTEL